MGGTKDCRRAEEGGSRAGVNRDKQTWWPAKARALLAWPTHAGCSRRIRCHWNPCAVLSASLAPITSTLGDYPCSISRAEPRAQEHSEPYVEQPDEELKPATANRLIKAQKHSPQEDNRKENERQQHNPVAAIEFSFVPEPTCAQATRQSFWGFSNVWSSENTSTINTAF